MSTHLEDRYDEKKDDVLPAEHLEYGKTPAHGGIISDNFGEYINDAARATEQQKGQSVRDAFRMYPKGVMFSLIFSTAIIMEVSSTSATA
jgi:hypothetical protein